MFAFTAVMFLSVTFPYLSQITFPLANCPLPSLLNSIFPPAILTIPLNSPSVALTVPSMFALVACTVPSCRTRNGAEKRCALEAPAQIRTLLAALVLLVSFSPPVNPATMLSESGLTS